VSIDSAIRETLEDDQSSVLSRKVAGLRVTSSSATATDFNDENISSPSHHERIDNDANY
jgi:hypothetical protein